MARESRVANRIESSGVSGRASELLALYEKMFLQRSFELTVQRMGKEGQIPGFLHLSIGQEASGVGTVSATQPGDWVVGTHRSHGHGLAKGVDPSKLLAEICGKETGVCGGRGCSMHWHSEDDHMTTLYSTIVASMIPIALGMAMSAQKKKTNEVVVCIFGDGATNHGAFHEAMNLTAIRNAPVVYVCENNGFATCIPIEWSTKNTNIASKAANYGIPGVRVDGMNVLEVHDAVLEAVERARGGGGPTLVEAMTYRFVGHHEGDQSIGVYRTAEEVESWRQRDPLVSVRNQLETLGVPQTQVDGIEGEVRTKMEEAVDFALSSPMPLSTTANTHVWANPLNPAVVQTKPSSETETQGWLKATIDGLAEEMRRDPDILYFGEGVGPRGGSFGETKGLWEEFGGERIIDTPISEVGFTGAGIGASQTGCRCVADLMFSDFITESASQIIHNAAKARYMSNGQVSVPLVVRAATGMMRNAAAGHSDCYHPIWAHVPGLVVAMPSNPADAKGLLKTALRASDPVILLEHKALFGSKGPVPLGDYYVPFGSARVVKEGNDITVVSCGLLLNRCIEAAESLEGEGIGCEVIDLRTIVPLDVETIADSLTKTRHLLVVDEAYAMCGIGAEIGAAMMELAFDALDAPIGRLHTDPVPIPFSPSLEDAVVVDVTKIRDAIRSVIQGNAVAVKRPVVGSITGGAGEPAQAEVGVLEQNQASATPGVVEGQEGAVPDGYIALKVPVQDLTVTQATIIEWKKRPGDRVKHDEAIVEVETDKALFEIDSPVDGVLAEIIQQKGSVVTLGQQIGWIAPAGVSA